MPIVRVELLEGRTVDQKRKLAAAITGVVVEHAAVRAEQVRVVFEDHETHNWAIAGELVVDRRARAEAAVDAGGVDAAAPGGTAA
jgi:4-oxalocrotonate tautomerase